MIRCESMWRWLRRWLPIGCFLISWTAPAGAQTLSSLERASEPAVLAVLGAGFLALGYVRRRYSGD